MYKCNWFLLQVIINIYKKLWNTWFSREWKNLVYSMLYGLWLSKVICVYEKLQMERLDIKLGGKHWNYLFCLPIEKFLSTHRKAELEICKILIDPKKMILVLALDVLCWGEFVQYTAELISVVDIIIHKLWNKNIFLGGILIIFTIDHAKILPFESRPFLAYTCHPMFQNSCTWNICTRQWWWKPSDISSHLSISIQQTFKQTWIIKWISHFSIVKLHVWWWLYFQEYYTANVQVIRK